jgi:hypothetical protein
MFQTEYKMMKQRYVKDRRKQRFGRRDLYYVKFINFLTITPERLLCVLAIAIITLLYTLTDLIKIWIRMIING